MFDNYNYINLLYKIDVDDIRKLYENKWYILMKKHPNIKYKLKIKISYLKK